MFLISNYQALGTLCHIEIFDEISIINLNFIKADIISEINKFENNFSRFKPNSEISLLNKNRFLINPSNELIKILQLSTKYFKETDGIFDIKIGHILAHRGYGFSFINNKEINQGEIILEPNQIKLEGDFEIDLGGIGKSYLIEKIKNRILDEYKLKYFLINFGGDIYVTSDKNNGIEISLENPLNPQELIGSVKLKNKAVCGSSPFKRVWKDSDNKLQNHIVTNSTKQAQFSSFVFAESIIDADVYATCLCINPEMKILNKDLGYIIINSEGKVIKTK